MFIIVGWRRRDCDDATGYMYCPDCRARMPAAQGVRKTYLTCFFIPLFPNAEHEAYYRCDGCQRVFNQDAALPNDFGDHADPKLWSCSRCGSTNLSHSYRCKRCGADA